MNYSNNDCRIRATASTFARLLRRKPARKAARASAKTVASVVTKAAAIFALAASASAQLIFQPLTEAASKDAKIYQHTPLMNFGTNLAVTSNNVGSHFLALIQFDLSGPMYPAADITSATITLYSFGLGVSGVPNAPGGTVTFSPVLDAWRETETPAGAAPLATYDAFFGATPTLHFGSAVASQNVTGAGFYTWDITSTVKSWADGSLPNNGLLIQLSTGGSDIGFSDVDSHPRIAGSQPSLTVVPEPGSVLLCVAGGAMLAARRRRESKCESCK